MTGRKSQPQYQPLANPRNDTIANDISVEPSLKEKYIRRVTVLTVSHTQKEENQLLNKKFEKLEKYYNDEPQTIQ